MTVTVQTALTPAPALGVEQAYAAGILADLDEASLREAVAAVWGRVDAGPGDGADATVADAGNNMRRQKAREPGATLPYVGQGNRTD